jgi:hypothetical protein
VPYQLQSALGAGLADAAGYMEGQTQKKLQQAAMRRQAQLDAQAQADTQARLQLAKQQAGATDAWRKLQAGNETDRLRIEQGNADRATAQATAEAAATAEKKRRDNLAQTFASKPFAYPPKWDKMKPDDKIAYLETRRSLAEKNYDTADVKSIDAEMERVRTDAAAQAKANAPPKPTWADLHPRPRAGRTETARDRYFDTHGYDPPTYSEAHPKPAKPKAESIPQQRSADADTAQSIIDQGGDYDKITRHYAAKWNIPLSRAQEELSEKQ